MLACMKLLTFGLSTNWESELLRADMARELGEEIAAPRSDLPGRQPDRDPPGAGYAGNGKALVEQIARIREQIGFATGASGSNNWAVSAERSATGGPLIAGDPHLPPSMPGIWYQVGLELGDRFCRGASLPGMPGVYMGQNNDVCWTFTNVMADVQDLFIERIEGDRYLFEGEWRPLEIVTESIEVKGRSEPVKHSVRLTHHGPIVNEALGADEAEPLALRWQALDFAGVSGAHLGVLEPRSGPELVELLEGFTMPASNLIWADRHGSIGYKTVGRLPIRRGDCPDLPKPGWTGEFEWDGYDPLRRAARGHRPRLRLPDHGQQPDRGRRLSRTTSPASTWTATAPSGSRSCCRPTSTTSTTSRGCRSTSTRSPARGRPPPRPARAGRPARDPRDRDPEELGRLR